MTMADPHRNNPESPYFRQPADHICDNADHAGEHHWTPTDSQQPDPEHLARLGLMDRQVGGDHYLGKRFQVWDIVEEYGLDYFEGSILAYLLRRKPGVPRAIDLRKARHYLDKCIAREEAKGG